jgi:hypothetical protein
MASRTQGHKVRAALPAKVDDAYTVALAVLEVVLHV